MKKILSFSLIAIYLMVPGNVLAQNSDDSQIDELVTIMVEDTN